MSRGHHEPDSSLRDVTRCVVVTRGDDLPAGLLASLEARGIETVTRNHPLDAFAQLVVWARDDRSAGGWGLAQPRLALVVASRDRWGSLDQFLQALSRHFPDVSVWMGTDELLLEISPQDRAEGAAGRSASSSARSVSNPPLRLAGTPDAPEGSPREGDARQSPHPSESSAAPRPEPEGQSSRTSPVQPRSPDTPRRGPDRPFDAAVTPDEIEMLLQIFDELDDDSRRNGGEERNP